MFDHQEELPLLNWRLVGREKQGGLLITYGPIKTDPSEVCPS